MLLAPQGHILCFLRDVSEKTVVGQFRKMDTIKPRLRRSPTLRHSPPLKHCHPSLRSEAVCSVNCFNAEWGIRCLVVSTESRSPRRIPRRRDDSLGVFGISRNQFFIKLTHHLDLTCTTAKFGSGTARSLNHH